MPDFLLLGLFAGFFLLHLLFVKKQQMFNHLLALYAASAAVMFLPRAIPAAAAWMSIIPYDRAGAFVLLLILLHVLLRFSALQQFSRRVAPSDVGTSVIYHIALSGLFFSALFVFLPQGTLTLGPIATFLFQNIIALFAWAMAPLFLAFSYRFKTRTGWIA